MSIGDTGSFVSSSQTPDYKADQYLTPKYLEKILRAIESSTPRRGNGYEVHASNRGWTLGIHNKPVGKKLRFFVVTTYNKDGTNYANVSVGMVNRTIPKLQNKYLDASGEPPKLTISSNGYIGILVNYTANKVFPNQSTIEFRSALEANDTTDSSFFPLASLVKNTETNFYDVFQLSDTNLVVNRMKVGSELYSWAWSN